MTGAIDDQGIDRLAMEIAARVARRTAAPAAPPALEATLALADRAVARVDRDGLRGVTLLSVAEIEAMALVIALTGATRLLATLAAVVPVTETTKGETA